MTHLKNVFDYLIILIILLFLYHTAERHWNGTSPQFIANQMKVIHFKTDSYLHNLGYYCGYPNKLEGNKGEWFLNKDFTLIDYFNSERLDIVNKQYYNCTKLITQSMALKTFSNFTDIPQPINITMADKKFSLVYHKKDISLSLQQILMKDFVVEDNQILLKVTKK